MNSHLTIELLQGYERHKLSRADQEIVSDHLYNCETCYQTFLTVLQHRFPIEIDLADLAGLKGWHLVGNELKSYLNGRMNEVDFNHASLHLSKCYNCRQEFYEACERQLESIHAGGGFLKRMFCAPAQVLSAIRLITPSLKTTGAALLVLSALSAAWFVSKPRSEPTQPLAESPTNQTPRLDPPPKISNAVPLPSPGSVGPPAHFTGGHAPVRKGAEVQARVTDRESALLAKNLVMPAVIKSFDRSQEVVVRGSTSPGETFSVLKPYGTVIIDDRPTFSWTPLNGVGQYEVSVYDDALNLVATSEAMTSTSWTIHVPLRRGITYTWIVTAQRDGKEIIAPALPARAEFKVIGEPELSALNHRIQPLHSHVARGAVYAEAGLLDAAEREFQVRLSTRCARERLRNFLLTLKSWRIAESDLPTQSVQQQPPKR